MRNEKINSEKLLACGFEFDGKNFVRREEILNQMTLTIIIDAGGSVTSKIFDSDGELYTLRTDDCLTDAEISARLEQSYRLAKNILSAKIFLL